MHRLGQIGLGVFALLGAFSAGREGPSVQIAASIMRHAHWFLTNARAIRAPNLALPGSAYQSYLLVFAASMSR